MPVLLSNLDYLPLTSNDIQSTDTNKTKISREIILDSGMEPGEWRIDRFIIQDKAGNRYSSNNQYSNKITSAGFITLEKDDLREKKINTIKLANQLGIKSSDLVFEVENNSYKDSTEILIPQIEDIKINKSNFDKNSIQKLNIEIDLKHHGNGFASLSDGWDILHSNDPRNDQLKNTFGYISFSNQDNRSLVIMLKTDSLSVLDENTSRFNTSIDLVDNIPSGKWSISNFAVLDKIGNQLVSPAAISNNGMFNSSGSYISIESEKYKEERTKQFAEFLGIPATNLSFDIENNADKVSDNNSPEILDINLNKPIQSCRWRSEFIDRSKS